MTKAPAFQFYPSDWQRDLSEHPLEIEGAWIRICCALWWSDTPGESTKPLTNWARILRVGERKCLSIITYLLNQNIAEVVIQNQTITIKSRRMVKDEYIRNVRRNSGCLGGNPNIKRKESKEVLLNQILLNQKSTPSSSSSTSTTKIKKEKPLFTLPDWIKKETWEAYREMRIRKRAPLTDRAATLIIKELENIKAQGQSVEDVLNQSIMKSWTGVFPIKTGGNGGSGFNANKSGDKRTTLQDEINAEVDAITRRRREREQASASGGSGGVPLANNVPDLGLREHGG